MLAISAYSLLILQHIIGAFIAGEPPQFGRDFSALWAAGWMPAELLFDREAFQALHRAAIAGHGAMDAGSD